VIDVALALPALMLVLLIMAASGRATGRRGSHHVVYIPGMYRILRGATQAISPRDYVLAAQARGERTRWIVRRELLPNIAPTLLVDLALRTVYAITFFATLSFLGLGAQPPSSNWGVMVSENRGLILTAPLAISRRRRRSECSRCRSTSSPTL
jgi:peptide/nickel transport system permease protein